MEAGGRSVRGATSKDTYVQKAGKKSRSRLHEEPILEFVWDKEALRTSAIGIHRSAQALRY